MSGRIFFTVPLNCPDIPITDSQSDLDDATPICGEMAYDTNLKDKDTKIKHECGQWRPMVWVAPEGGGTPVYDYSWHHPGPPYAYGYADTGGTVGDPTPTPTGDEREPETTPSGGTPEVPEDPVFPPEPSIDENAPGSLRANSQQAQWGWPPPSSPGFSQRVNILSKFNHDNTAKSANAVGTWIFTKPKGYDVLRISTWIEISEDIPAGESINLQLMVGVHDGDRAPTQFESKAIVLKDTRIKKGQLIRVIKFFGVYDKAESRVVTAYFERRNDVAPNANAEVWVTKHVTTFRVAEVV